MKEQRRCEHCRKLLPFPEGDYCRFCSRNLCDRCMREGCCGHVPAISGLDEDYPENGADGETCTPKAPSS